MNDNKFGIFLVVGVLFGLFLLTRKSGATNYVQSEPEYEYPPLRLQPMARAPEPSNNGNERRYRNNETWDIEWNPDGLPSKVTIHRDAVQS